VCLRSSARFGVHGSTSSGHVVATADVALSFACASRGRRRASIPTTRTAAPRAAGRTVLPASGKPVRPTRPRWDSAAGNRPMGHRAAHPMVLMVDLRIRLDLTPGPSSIPAADNLHSRSKPTKASVTCGPSNSRASTQLILPPLAALRRKRAHPKVGYSGARREARHLGRSGARLEEMPGKEPRWVPRWEACSVECGGVDGCNRRSINKLAINSNNKTPLTRGGPITTARLEPA
jgi:hypothetical protein